LPVVNKNFEILPKNQIAPIEKTFSENIFIFKMSLIAKENVWQWYEDNKELFDPPVCNKLMHRDQLTIMFVGGPNTRTDFHLDQGSEFFYMLRGNMQLPIIEKGKKRIIDIKEGEVFLLPSCVPHSPQRPEQGSLGLVVERRRLQGEVDGLRWYTDFENPTTVLWEKFFQCFDLGRDLVPVVKEFHASPEKSSNKPSEKSVYKELPFKINDKIEVPSPFSLNDWLKTNEKDLNEGKALNLFPDHPDKEFNIKVCGGPSKQSDQWQHETWLYQLKGGLKIKIEDGEWETIKEGECAIVGRNKKFQVEREKDSVGFWLKQDPCGNNPENANRKE